MNTLQVEEKQQRNIFDKMIRATPTWEALIDRSFMSHDFKDRFQKMRFRAGMYFSDTP